ncbi:MAG: ATP-binding protein [Phycisphaerales bacterium]|nr:ATP-binding protein [Phycisphaerales bacterium]
MSSTPQVRLQLPSNPLFLSGAREMVYQFASRCGFSDESCGQLALAVDEALCNVIRHGYGKAPDKPIWLSMTFVGGVATPETQDNNPTEALRIVIEDEAKQVDPTTIKSRDLDEIRPGGLGVHIITEVMDEVRWEKRTDGPIGMRLTMMKKRVPAGKAGEGEKCADGAAEGSSCGTEGSKGQGAA